MYDSCYKFLYENAGPIIKNEAAKILGTSSEAIREEMLCLPEVQYWIDCSQSFMENPRVHDSFDTRLENWGHKLISFGITEEDDKRIADVNKYILRYIKENQGNGNFFDSISNVIAASYLARMGCEDKIVLDIIKGRIEAVYPVAKQGDFDIYADKKDFPRIPKARDRHPLVKPELYKGNVWRLPTLHDIFAFSKLPRSMASDTELKSKIEAIIEYIMTPEYQKLPWGYGLMLVPPNTYYSMGWSVKLSRFFMQEIPNGIDPILWETELMSHFDTARSSKWFEQRMDYLESFKKGSIYDFPKSFLTEAKNKYYVGGGHMGLGENRRKKSWSTIESTAWMMRILHNSGI
jgi:hypothetical protein